MKKWVIILIVVIAVIVLSLVSIKPNSSKTSSSKTNNQGSSNETDSNVSSAEDIAESYVDAKLSFDFNKARSYMLFTKKEILQVEANSEKKSLDKMLKDKYKVNSVEEYIKLDDEDFKNRRKKDYGKFSFSKSKESVEDYSSSEFEKSKKELKEKYECLNFDVNKITDMCSVRLNYLIHKEDSTTTNIEYYISMVKINNAWKILHASLINNAMP